MGKELVSERVVWGSCAMDCCTLAQLQISKIFSIGTSVSPPRWVKTKTNAVGLRERAQQGGKKPKNQQRNLTQPWALLDSRALSLKSAVRDEISA